MDRDTFRLVAAGQFAYCLSANEANIEQNKMRLFVDGAIFAYDKLNKSSKSETNSKDASGLCKNLRTMYGNTLD